MSIENSIAATFRQFCDESGYRFHRIDRSTFLGIFGLAHGTWMVFCDVENTVLYFISRLPIVVPPRKQSDALDYLNRINWQTAIGSFEMDPSDGEVRFRTSIDCADGELTPNMIKALLIRNLITCDRYLPGLLQITLNNLHPLGAMRVAEKMEDEDEPNADDLIDLLNDVDLGQLSDKGEEDTL